MYIYTCIYLQIVHNFSRQGYRCIACAVGESICTSDIEIAGMTRYVCMYACMHIYIDALHALLERACVQVI